MEIAEVASMSMELFTMNHWDAFFDNKEDLKRAKEHQLERVITIFPWIATIDKFQHWVYEHPQHTVEERTAAWMEILNEFSTDTVDFSGLEKYRENSWQRQFICLKFRFIILNMALHNWAPLAYGSNT